MGIFWAMRSIFLDTIPIVSVFTVEIETKQATFESALNKCSPNEEHVYQHEVHLLDSRTLHFPLIVVMPYTLP